MSKLSRVTIKGQVTIPKDVRDSLGVKPGEEVEFDRNAAGEIVLRKVAEDHGVRRAAFRARIEETTAKYAHLREGRPTDEIMRDIRGDDPFPP